MSAIGRKRTLAECRVLVESRQSRLYVARMPFARKIILHAPISDEALLDDFVEQCLRDNVSLIAVIGPDCNRIEDVIDEIVVGDGTDPARFLCTTSHAEEPLDEVMNMAITWEFERGDPVQEVWL